MAIQKKIDSQLTVPMESAMKERLVKLADRQGISVAEAARRMISLGLSRQSGSA